MLCVTYSIVRSSEGGWFCSFDLLIRSPTRLDVRAMKSTFFLVFLIRMEHVWER